MSLNKSVIMCYMVTIDKVKRYWQEHPVYGYELRDIGTEGFFCELEKVKRDDVERFSLTYWGFDRFKDKLVLDVGCGPGWLTVNYAINGAKAYAIDLTTRAVSLTKDFLRYKGVSANVNEGNAEDLIFKDNFFDLVVASGVLHHTTDVLKAMKEVYRVLKPGGEAKITLYRKGILHSKLIFGILRFVMNILRVKHPGADLSHEAKDVDDFIRQYDGAGNPLGIGKTCEEWSKMLRQAGFVISGYELHFFPKRFMPFSRLIPDFIHYLLDRYLGTMIYFNLTKE